MFPDNFYDKNTENILRSHLTEEDLLFVRKNKIDLENHLFNHWKLTLYSLNAEYTSEYISLETQEERNIWFKKYIEYPTYKISKIPATLLPLNQQNKMKNK
jgi:hypothetical protein